MWAIILETCFGMAEKVYHMPANKGRTTVLQIELIRSQWEGTSLVAQWLRFPAPSAGRPGSIPG